MNIYMTHPKHGAMHVYLEAEAVENEKNGWKRLENPVFVEPVAVIKNITEQYTAKYGHAPHHRMKPETIQAALDGNR